MIVVLKLTWTSTLIPAEKKLLICSQKALRQCPPAGFISIARIVVTESGEYELQVLFRTIESGKLTNITNFVDLSSKISSSGGYKFCPGLSTVLYKET